MSKFDQIRVLQCTLLKKTGQVEKLFRYGRSSYNIAPESVPVWLERLKTNISLGADNQEILNTIEECLNTLPKTVTSQTNTVFKSNLKRRKVGFAWCPKLHSPSLLSYVVIKNKPQKHNFPFEFPHCQWYFLSKLREEYCLNRLKLYLPQTIDNSVFFKKEFRDIEQSFLLLRHRKLRHFLRNGSPIKEISEKTIRDFEKELLLSNEFQSPLQNIKDVNWSNKCWLWLLMDPSKLHRRDLACHVALSVAFAAFHLIGSVLL